jgi:hypothetical protein
MAGSCIPRVVDMLKHIDEQDRKKIQQNRAAP